MAVQSQFSKLPKKQLVFIAEKLVDEEFPIGNPYDSDFDGAYDILKQVANYFSLEATQEDVEFFSKFLEVNENIIADLFANNREQMRNTSLIERLVIPVAKTYDLHYTMWGSCTYTEYLAQKFDSYDKNWVKDSADQQREDGNWDYYNGRKLRDTEYDNFEESDHSYDEVYEVNDDKTINTNFVSDSILDKLVIENTEDVINSLDKKTLIELRRIIDSKLRLL
jgi:S-adenosylmethionine/arginine decarboxylase-like enzyme